MNNIEFEEWSQEVRNWLEQAVDGNVIIYDVHSQGKVTVKLLYQLHKYAWKSCREPIHTFYIPKDSFEDGEVDIPNKFFNSRIVEIDGLRYNEEFERFYRDTLNGSHIIAINSQHLVLAITPNFVILGGF